MLVVFEWWRIHFDCPAIGFPPNIFQEYMDKYGQTMFDVSSDFGPIPPEWKQKTQEDKEKV